MNETFIDCLGNKLIAGDVILFAATWDRSAILKMAVVIDPNEKRVWSSERWGDTWTVSARKSQLQYANKTVKISEEMIISPEARIALSEIKLKLKEYEK
jgi:hypothetical protein